MCIKNKNKEKLDSPGHKEAPEILVSLNIRYNCLYSNLSYINKNIKDQREHKASMA